MDQIQTNVNASMAQNSYKTKKKYVKPRIELVFVDGD